MAVDFFIVLEAVILRVAEAGFVAAGVDLTAAGAGLVAIDFFMVLGVLGLENDEDLEDEDDLEDEKEDLEDEDDLEDPPLE